jgi:ketosteroid isomerase-like protein
MNETTPRNPVSFDDRRAELSDLATRFVDALNRRDIDDVMSFFAASAVYEDAYGDRHEGLSAIRTAFEPVLDGRLGDIQFGADDRFIDADDGKVMDSWRLRMHIGEGKERTLRGLDLLHLEGNKLVRKITYKQD